MIRGYKVIQLEKYTYFLAIISFLVLVPIIITKDPYHLYILIQIFIWGTASVSLWLTIRTGIFNLGHAAFMAIGAYTTALLTAKGYCSFWLTLPISGALAITLAIIIGIPILRVKGMYFVLVTCALCEVVKLVIVNFPEYTGGYNGVHNIIAPKILAIDFSNRVSYYYLVLSFMVVSLFICYRIWNSQFGKIFKGIAANESLSESVGIPTTKYKIMSFAIASFFAALCGCFMAPFSSTIDPLMFGFGASINCFLYIVLGGFGSIFGPLYGTAFAILIFELFRFMLQLAPAILGILVIIIMIFVPEGLIGVQRKIFRIIKTHWI